MTSSPRPEISVLCITYKHEAFIRQALDGFVSQKVNVPFEIIIGNDCSPDSTETIINEYVHNYPNIIVPVTHTVNIGAAKNFASIVNRIHGRYVAICDGDDFWTDPLKLQKQYDFLENHQDYTVCFHKVRQLFEDHSQPDVICGPEQYLPDVAAQRDYFIFEDLLRINVISSLSVMYRWKLGTSLPSWMLNYAICDLPLHLIHADTGKIGYINEEMGSYRRHSGGSWWNHESLEHRKKNTASYISLLEHVNAYLNNRHDKIFIPILRILKQDLQELEKEGTQGLPTFFSKLRWRLVRHFAWKGAQ